MSNLDFEKKKWKIDRLPSRAERIVAAISGLVGTIVSVAFSYVFGSADTDGYLSIVFSAFFLLLGVVSIRVTYSAVFTQATKPSRKSQLILIWVCFLVSLGLIAGALSLDDYKFIGVAGILLSWSIYRLNRIYTGAYLPD